MFLQKSLAVSCFNQFLIFVWLVFKSFAHILVDSYIFSVLSKKIIFILPFHSTLDKPCFSLCISFSLLVTHSKFSTKLFVLLPSIWFTWGLFSGFSINEIATNLWTNGLLLFCPFLFNTTLQYPQELYSIGKISFVSLFLTCPNVLTSYRSS